MPDPYLEAMMHGEFSPDRRGSPSKNKLPKDRYDVEFDKKIKLYVDALSFDESAKNLLESTKLKKAKEENELKKSLKIAEVNEAIESALHILSSEGMFYTDTETYASMKENFIHAIEILDRLDLEHLQAESLGKTLGITNKTIETIFKMAVAKYEEENYSISLSLFIFLTILQPEDFDYWYRVAIVAHHVEKYALALKAYAAAFCLNDQLIGARIFSIECYLKLGQIQDAVAEYEEAQKMIELGIANDDWSTVLSHAKILIESYSL